jgi:hypothetical protein
MMSVVKLISIIFTQIALESFKEDIVRECVDSHMWVKWVKLVCTVTAYGQFRTRRPEEGPAFVTHLGLL